MSSKPRGTNAWVTGPADLLANTERQGDCMVWTLRRHEDGYGRLNYRSRPWKAHRLVYALLNGPIPPGYYVLHRCDNPPCINPSHLFLGTPDDNVKDCVRKGRSSIGERNGCARLTIEQVREIRASTEGDVALAARFGVGRTTVREARQGRKWAKVL